MRPDESAILLRGMVMTVGCLLLGAAAAAQSSAPAATSPDTALWTTIESLSTSAPQTQPYEARFAREKQRRRELLDKLALYLRLYPGGPQRDAAIRLEFQTLFDAYSAGDSPLSALCERSQERLRSPPSPDAADEAAFWELQCSRLRHGRASGPPAAVQSAAEESAWRAAREAFIDRHPRNRHTPRVAETLFDEAELRSDVAAMRRIANRMQQESTGSIGKRLAGRLWRAEAVGKPLDLTFEASDGSTFDVSAWRGEPTIVLLWDFASPGSVEPLGQAVEFARERGAARVASIVLGAGGGRVNGLRDDRGPEIPQWCVPTDRERDVKLQWAVRETPFVIAIDRSGRIAAIAEGAAWRSGLRNWPN